MSRTPYPLALPCAALCAALALPAAAQEQPTTTQPGTAQSEPGQSGMIVVRDAQSGELRAPTAAESRALAPQRPSASLQAQPTAPALVTHPGGARQVRLGERGLVYSVATRGADGKLSEQCVQGAHAAEQAVHAPAAAPRQEDARE